MICIAVIAGTIIVRKDCWDYVAEYRTLAEKNLPFAQGLIRGFRGAMNPAPVTNFLSGLSSQIGRVSRAAHAAVDPQEAWLQEGERLGRQRALQQALLSRVPAPGTSRGVLGTVDRSGTDIGGDGRGDETRALLSQYAPKPSFPLTPQGQFDRYFGTSGEMDPYFGAASRGAGAPKNVQDMLALASQRTAPGSTPQDLATYYRAQSAAGRGSMDEIVSGLTYGKTGKEAENLTAWAKANPMLAMREYNKRFPGGQPTMGTGELATTEALQGTRYQGVGGQGFGAATAPGSVQGMDSTSALSVPPELKPFTLPGGAFTQGRAVSAPYDTAQAQAAWKTNPQNWASQQIPGVSERAEEFIKGLKPFSDSKVDTLF